MTLLVRWLVLAAALAVATWLLPGIDADWSLGSYLITSAVYATVNLLIGPVLKLLSAPLIIITLGLFTLVVNALLLFITDWLVDSFDVDGFLTAVVGGVVISLISLVINLVVRPGRDRA